jgi:hypothetical protein
MSSPWVDLQQPVVCNVAGICFISIQHPLPSRMWRQTAQFRGDYRRSCRLCSGLRLYWRTPGKTQQRTFIFSLSKFSSPSCNSVVRSENLPVDLSVKSKAFSRSCLTWQFLTSCLTLTWLFCAFPVYLFLWIDELCFLWIYELYFLWFEYEFCFLWIEELCYYFSWM